MNILEESDGDIIYDPTSIDWTKFKWEQGYLIHRIEKTEIMKPYLIAYAYFEDSFYEDIILLLNNIEDVLEIIPGTELRIPKKLEIDEFLRDNTK